MRTSCAFTFVALLGSLGALAPATGDEPKLKPVKVGIVTNCTADFWDICAAGAKKAAVEHKVELDFQQPERAFDARVQTDVVAAWAKQGLDGIAVAVIDPDGQGEDLARVAKKVPLVTIDNDADKTGRLCHIGIDNYEAGNAAGRLVKKALPDGGTVALFIGSTKSANGKARVQGVLDELAGAKDAKGEAKEHPKNAELKCKAFGKYLLVDGEAKEDGDPSKAQQQAGAVLARLNGIPDVALIGLYAYNPPAILAAAKERKVAGKVKIVGFDEDWKTLEGIAAGEIEATVVQDPFMYGYKTVAILAAKARGAKLPDHAVPYRVVTKDGGPDEKVGGAAIKNLKVADFEKELRGYLSPPK